MVVAVVVLLALIALAVLVPSVLGFDPRWVALTRHAFGEARYRASGVLAEFGDWLRLGR